MSDVIHCYRGHVTTARREGQQILPCGCVLETATEEALRDAGPLCSYPPPEPHKAVLPASNANPTHLTYEAPNGVLWAYTWPTDPSQAGGTTVSTYPDPPEVQTNVVTPPSDTHMAGGQISPKVAIPTSVLIALGAVVAVLDLLGVIEVDDELWIGLLGAGGVTGVTGYSAKPGNVARGNKVV